MREALSELRTEPKDAFQKLSEIFKEIWAKVVEVGLIAAISDAVKSMFSGSSATLSSSIAATRDGVTGLSQGAGAPLVAVEAGVDTPLLASADKV